jgi:hypothetical protein
MIPRAIHPFSQRKPPAAWCSRGIVAGGATDLRLFQHEPVIVSDADDEPVAEFCRYLNVHGGQGVGYILNRVPRKFDEQFALFLRHARLSAGNASQLESTIVTSTRLTASPSSYAGASQAVPRAR